MTENRLETTLVSNDRIQLKPEHVKLRFEINSRTIDEFHINEEERRKIRKGVVNEILRQLENGIHFESDIVVNKVDGKYNIIDGNHRTESVKLFLRKYPRASVIVNLAKYENLSRIQEEGLRIEKIREKEREIYSKWNKGTPENATDYLQQHFATIPCGQEMLDKLPVGVYATDKRLPIKVLVGAYVMAKKQTVFSGGYSADGEQTVEDFKHIDSEDIRVIRAFVKDMVEVFGEYRKGSEYYRGTPLNAFFRIWYDNRKSIPQDKLVRLFKTKILNNWSRLNELSKSGGSMATKMFYRVCLKLLNGTRSNKLFYKYVDRTRESTTVETTEDDTDIDEMLDMVA